MNELGKWERFQAFLRDEIRSLTTVNESDRKWHLPFTAALATGLPLLIGAYFDHLNYGVVSSLGGLVFLYMPPTPLYHRMVALMACAFGMTACYALGLMSHLLEPTMMLVLIFISILVTMICRFYGVGPPGSLFFIMAASIGAYSPVELMQLPLLVGLFIMGSLLACMIGFIYSLCILRIQKPLNVPTLIPPSFDFVVYESVVIGVFVGISLAAAQVLNLQKAYWVPVSCLAVIQGATLRAVWSKQLHRILGTVIGLLVSFGLLLFPLDQWSICLAMMILTFIVESAIVRHYAFAAIFITPLTILLGETATLGQSSASALIQARFIDTLLGCLVGLMGGVCLHSPRFRLVVGGLLRRLMPNHWTLN